ncbi:MAG: IS110 family transposase [Actinomycetota bacterium]|nr:IS110 family transposase [Actinomycetota bacterium]
MTSMTRTSRVVIGGVDTHKDVHVAAVVDEVGKIIDTASLATSAKGCNELLAWMRSHGELAKVAVEGTGCYGAGLARLLEDEGVEVVEVNRPNRQARRRRGRSDTVDAEAAARAALNGEATVAPKAKTSVVESIRVLRVAFTSARRARTQAALQIRDLIVTAPDELRAELGSLSSADRVARCARFRLGVDASEPLAATRVALRTLARRYEALSEEMGGLEQHLDELTAKANPVLRGVKGVGVDVAAILLTAAGENPDRLRNEAAFAALCGVSPVEASSGKVVRHRLNRSGNRQANHALWRIVMVRLTCDERTKTYAARRRAEGKSDRDIVRCLKRYVAREVFRHLTAPETIPAGEELRAARQGAGLSLAIVAQALGTWPIRISRLERSLDFDTALARRYEAFLAAELDAGARQEENAA